MAMVTYPIAITEYEDGLRHFRCIATREQNHGESCLWTWIIPSTVEGDSESLRLAIKHCKERH